MHTMSCKVARPFLQALPAESGSGACCPACGLLEEATAPVVRSRRDEGSVIQVAKPDDATVDKAGHYAT